MPYPENDHGPDLSGILRKSTGPDLSPDLRFLPSETPTPTPPSPGQVTEQIVTAEANLYDVEVLLENLAKRLDDYVLYQPSDVEEDADLDPVLAPQAARLHAFNERLRRVRFGMRNLLDALEV